ncbi:MAG TPA: polysaccharide biosynthesis tyrosine autokinase [Cyclobacteriaceae bacterium]|nr:polysaccharide biosynthesis tyrosine autokinase [Cyclobacteriaceae bacterium]
MKNSPDSKLAIDSNQDTISLEKLLIIFKRNLVWLILIFVACSTAAYLVTRWTKDIYESESELKLDIKREATELGIKGISQDPDMDVISGEIEQIRSKLFFSKIIDSLDIRVSYFSEGNVLFNELYKISPFRIKLLKENYKTENIPIYLTPISETSFKLKFGAQGQELVGNFGDTIKVEGAQFIVINSGKLNANDPNDYYFVINSRDRLVGYLSGQCTVEPLNFNANTIRISFKDNNALKAHDIVNKIDSLYIYYSNSQKNLANKQKIEWLNRELSELEKRMEEFENYFESFTLQNKSSNVAEDMRRTIYQINKYDSQRYSLNKKIIEINTLIENLVSKKQTPSSYQYSFLPDYLNKKLEALSIMAQERDKLSLAYNENTLTLRQKEKELSTLKDQLFGQLNMLRESWMNSLTEIVENKRKLEQEFLSMPDKNTKFSKNQRFYNLFTEFYLSMMQSKAQFEIAQAGTTPDFKILSSASMPSRPVSPKKMAIIGIGVVAGIILNFFFIGLTYLLDNKVTNVKDIEAAVTLPVLGIIPSSQQTNFSTFYVHDSPKSRVSEAIRSLRTNLDFFTSGGHKKVITISSTISGEGKSFLARNLGGVLAMSKKKVVLVDLDMRKAKKDDFYNGERMNQGLSTILIRKNNWTECIQKTTIENLDFIPSGPHPPNPSELLLNGEFSNLIDELQQEYDFVIMDTPPVGLVTDGIMAMRKSDLSIYVVRANYSRKEFLKNVDRTVTVNKLFNVAIVLNALPKTGKEYGFAYYEEPTKKGLKKLFS